MHGVIGNQIRASAYARIFEGVARSKSYRALLLDIDSPGGSAAASEALHRSIERVAESKPVVAYVRGIGASGGYYLCCAASQVYALPTALVGSIGVIYLRPVLEQLLGRAGVEFTIFKGGKYKDMTGFWRSPTAEESEKLQGLITEIYDNFVQVVVKGRSLSEEAVRELATGEVMTGQKGIENGLVDHIGDFTDALDAAAEAGKTRPRPKFLQPRRTLSQRLFGGTRVGRGGGDGRAGRGAATNAQRRNLLPGPGVSGGLAGGGLGNPGALGQQVRPQQLGGALNHDAHGPAFRVEVDAQARRNGLFRVADVRRLARLEPERVGFRGVGDTHPIFEYAALARLPIGGKQVRLKNVGRVFNHNLHHFPVPVVMHREIRRHRFPFC